MEKVSSLETFFKNKNIGFVCNNSGGGYVIKHLIKKYNLKEKVLVKGSSKKFFKKKNFKNNFFKKLNLLICGTSTPGDFEIRYMLYAKKRGIKTIFILDHWTNYKERFKYNNSYFYPDEIWCGDVASYKIAKKELNPEKIKLFKNPVFDFYIKNGRKQKKLNSKNNILYVSSNFERMPLQINENTIFESVLKIYNQQNFNLIYFRPHPSDNKKKIPSFFKNFSCRIDKNDELYKILKNVKLVIGTNSFALVLAKFFGCKTINIVPKNMQNTLPDIYIDELVKV